VCTRVLSRPRRLHGDPRAYLMTVLRNTFTSSLRTASRRPAVVAALNEEIAESRTGEPEGALAAREVFQAIAELPDIFRFALVAVDVLGLSYEEAGRALGVPAATITTRLYRARRRVAAALSAAAAPV
jgi:RNA polymerase sigma-70 factor (ECF subfamily)